MTIQYLLKAALKPLSLLTKMTSSVSLPVKLMEQAQGSSLVFVSEPPISRLTSDLEPQASAAAVQTKI